jgi:hypothetical protein
MGSRKSILGLGLCAALAYAGYDWVSTHVEVVTLHAAGLHDYYPRLFIVDDGSAAWIRAERPDRLWLAPLRENPRVVVRRGDQDLPYTAVVWNGEGAHESVDALFLAKYGLLDRVSGWVWRRDAVPIRLEPRDPWSTADGSD